MSSKKGGPCLDPCVSCPNVQYNGVLNERQVSSSIISGSKTVGHVTGLFGSGLCGDSEIDRKMILGNVKWGPCPGLLTYPLQGYYGQQFFKSLVSPTAKPVTLRKPEAVEHTFVAKSSA